MRTVYLLFFAVVCMLATESWGLAQVASNGFASDDSARIKLTLDRYQAIMGPPGPNEGAALNALCMSLDEVPKAECQQKVRLVTRLYRNAMIQLKDQPERIEALPDVYSGQYKRGRVADMSVTDQIGMANFQYTYIAFLAWYIQCYPLPNIGKIPLEVPTTPNDRFAPPPK